MSSENDMELREDFVFPPFRLDLANEQLWRDEQLIALRPKTFAILCYLVEHPGRLVTKDELLRAVWGETQVSEEGLRDYLREIRRALGDDAEAPRFVETVRGRGYRFLATISTIPPVSGSPSLVSGSPLTSKPQSLTPSLPLPDKPSIIVLPFVNLSKDPEQAYFSDGITEDLTNSLSRLASLFVISRTSAFMYKNKPTKVQDISQEMGVQYVLEGSVRRVDNQVRVTTQLVDAITDHHLWSERYDRPLTDIFAVQDEIVQKIVTALRVKLTPEEQSRFQRAPTANLEAYDYYLRGMESFWRAYYTTKKELNGQARQMLEKAIALDPQYAGAYAGLGGTYWLDWFSLWSPDPAQSLGQASELASKAIALHDSLSLPHRVLGGVYLWKKQHDQAVTEGERAITLDPNDADAYETLASILIFAGRLEEVPKLIEKAMRLNPQYPPSYLLALGFAYRVMRRYEEALVPLQKVLPRSQNHIPTHVHLAVCYAELWREAEARAEVMEILRINPHFSLEWVKRTTPYKDPTVLECFLDSLRKAGLK